MATKQTKQACVKKPMHIPGMNFRERQALRQYAKEASMSLWDTHPHQLTQFQIWSVIRAPFREQYEANDEINRSYKSRSTGNGFSEAGQSKVRRWNWAIVILSARVLDEPSRALA